jgi:excisionase family DNA binding protein
MSSTAGNGEIMTIRDVAGHLKVTERTICRLLSPKRLPAFKVGGSWRFKMVDIDRSIKLQSENLATSEVSAALRERE